MPDWASEIPSAPVHDGQPKNELTRALTPQQLLEIGQELIEQFLKRVVLATVGFFIPGAHGAAFDQLKAWADGLPDVIKNSVIGDIVEAFTGEEDGDLNDIGTAFIKLKAALEGIDWQSGDPGAVLASIIAAARNFVRAFLPSQLGVLDIGALTARRRNLVVSGNFADLASIVDNRKWKFDATVSRTGDDTGSARTIANGTLRALRMKDAVAVAEGQPFKLTTYAKCSSIVTSGPAFHLDVVRFSGDPTDPDSLVELGIDRLATLSPGNGSHDWALLQGTFTIPAGTTCVKGRLVVDGNVTAGTVWFDDVKLESTGWLLMEWMPEVVQKFLALFNIFGPGGLIEEVQEAWQNLLSLLHIPDPHGLIGTINPATIWQNIVEFLINPLQFFANLVGGKLPDGQKPQWLIDLTDALSNAASDASDIGTGISNAIAGIGRLLGVGSSAQQSADNANIGVQILNAQMNAVGTVGSDEFDYVSANTLPSGSYALSSLGAGGGNYGPNGAGRLVWKPSGFLTRQKIYKRTDMPLETNNGAVTAVWSTKIKDPLFSDGHGYLCGRMFDSNNDTHIRADIDNNTARIQVVSSGVVTQIGSSASVDTSDGDVWEFWYGTLSNPYVFWLKQNGTLVRFGGNTYVEDTGHISGFMLTSNYRMCGFGGQADNYAAVFQIAPPTLNGWTWRDQNLTAVA